MAKDGMNNRKYANVMLRNELRCSIHARSSAVEMLLLLLLPAVCALPEGLAFETPNEDLLLTGSLVEWHLLPECT